MSKRSLAIAVGFFLSAVVSSPASAWQADRIDLSEYWIITCNDGFGHGDKYGADGPDFFTGGKVCEKHGGLVTMPPPIGTLTQFAVETRVPFDLTSPVSVENLFSAGLITANDAFKLTDSFDLSFWSDTLVSFGKVSDPNSFDGVAVFGLAVDLTAPVTVPEPSSLGLLVVGLMALGLVRRGV